MKRLLCLICALIFLLTVTACSDNENEIRMPANFYYCTAEIEYDSELGVIASEVRETDLYYDNFMLLFNHYMRGPSSSALVSPFPVGSEVVQINQNDSEIVLIMNLQFAQLTGLKLSLACACLSKTVFSLTTVETVTIRCRDGSLDGKVSININRDSFLLQDKALVQSPAN
jgi:hypothetical protein